MNLRWLERNRVFGLETLLVTFLQSDGDPLGCRRD
jgi:hypothetical protein